MNYRWFRISILLGVGLAILLLVNSISNYLLVSRRVVVEQSRHDLARSVAGLDQQIQQSAPGRVPDLGLLVEQVRQNSQGKIAWIHIRDLDGVVLARAGLALDPAFPVETFRCRPSGGGSVPVSVAGSCPKTGDRRGRPVSRRPGRGDLAAAAEPDGELLCGPGTADVADRYER